MDARGSAPAGARRGRPRSRPTGLRTVPDEVTRVDYRTIHGYRRAFRTAGEGPPVVLVHGIGDDSSTWDDVIGLLAAHHRVIAPDLLGHGLSDKPRADYSVAAYANGLRDLLTVLGVERATIVGHSLGGGVAMQFAYQHPELVERLVLVSSGGITSDVHPVLRLVTLPGVSSMLGLLRLPGAVDVVRLAGSLVTRAARSALAPVTALHDTPDVVRVLSGLAEATAVEAYLRTLRSVVDRRGQVVSMLDRCYLTQGVPVQIVWGEHDSVVPVDHAYLAHSAMPEARLDIFRRTGHFPFRDDPARFVNVVEEFLATTTPHVFDRREWARLLAAGVGEDRITGDARTRSEVLAVMGTAERSAT